MPSSEGTGLTSRRASRSRSWAADLETAQFSFFSRFGLFLGLATGGIELVLNAVDLVVGSDEDKGLVGDVAHRLGEGDLLDVESEEVGLLDYHGTLEIERREGLLDQPVSLVQVEVLQQLQGVGFFLLLEELGDGNHLLRQPRHIVEPLEGDDEGVLAQQHVDVLLQADASLLEGVSDLAGHAVDHEHRELVELLVGHAHSEHVRVQVLVDDVVTCERGGQVVLMPDVGGGRVLRHNLVHFVARVLQQRNAPDLSGGPALPDLVARDQAVFNDGEEDAFSVEVQSRIEVSLRVSVHSGSRVGSQLCLVDANHELVLLDVDQHEVGSFGICKRFPREFLTGLSVEEGEAVTPNNGYLSERRLFLLVENMTEEDLRRGVGEVGRLPEHAAVEARKSEYFAELGEGDNDFLEPVQVSILRVDG
eukprot:CAMPEP_0170482020 /NCGR_PEP_ID=MMETSP0208-20121228/2226_1 /TAXON_ID=197538 /ORGANISM="Strombidium inclinatum, Strain S3" /LENGTH=419 /DNA_ID=CAMNT_0010754815 /DNA_START=299 /DNA_END=1560 /DNA_ORIENTATION=-